MSDKRIERGEVRSGTNVAPKVTVAPEEAPQSPFALRARLEELRTPDVSYDSRFDRQGPLIATLLKALGEAANIGLTALYAWERAEAEATRLRRTDGMPHEVGSCTQAEATLAQEHNARVESEARLAAHHVRLPDGTHVQRCAPKDCFLCDMLEV